MQADCVVSEHIHTCPVGGQWEILSSKGKGSKKATTFKGEFKAKLDFQGEWGGVPNQKTFHGRGWDITHLYFIVFV